MKKLYLSLLPLLLLTSCNLSGSRSSTPKYTNEDISPVDINIVPSDVYLVDEEEAYYESNDICLYVEVNGSYEIIKYFTIDENNNNLRIYDNMYFYQYDYFQMMPNDEKDINIYASLSDEKDKQYVEEYRSEGVDIQIDVKVAGIYKLIFDLTTMKFDIEYKGAIDTPKYYPIQTAKIASLPNGGGEVSYTQMTEEGDKFVAKNVEFDVKTSLSFHSINYVSWYKITLGEGVENKLAFYLPTNQEKRKKQTIKLMVGGRYNISIDKNTYEVDLELLNVDTAQYVVEVYADDALQELEPVSASTSYLYEFNYTASKDMAFAPYFYDAALKKITFTNLNTTLLITGDEFVMFKKAGNYKLTINMRDYSIDAVQLD